MKRQDLFLIGCLMTALSFLYFESSSSDFQPFSTLSDPSATKQAPFNSSNDNNRLPAINKDKVVEMEVATVE